jgi:hypothetical protein
MGGFYRLIRHTVEEAMAMKVKYGDSWMKTKGSESNKFNSPEP